MTDRPDIFEYVDYRAFMRDCYAWAKANDRVMSYRYLSRRAGFSSPNFIKLVMDGGRNLGDESISTVASAFDLKSEEVAFFEALVHFDQAVNAEHKNQAYRTIAASRRFRSARRIDHDMFKYLSHWYYPAIREMAGRPDFQNDEQWVSKQLWPPVPPREVRSALDTLFDLGLLVLNGDVVSRGEPSLTTGHEVRSLAIGNFHREMMARAAESIETVERERRDISALTVCIPRSLVPSIKEEIHAFRESMLELCDAAEEPNTVYQINFQLFPLTVKGDS